MGDVLRDLRDLQFAQVESELLRNPGITIQQKVLYSLLITYGPSNIFPGQQRLADELGVKRETVNRWLGQLRKIGLVTWQRREGTSNLYAILGYQNYLDGQKPEGQQEGDVIEGSHLDNLGVIPRSHPLCASDHIPCDPTITRSRSNYPDPITQMWDLCLRELKMQMDKATYERWLAGSELVSFEDGTATIAVRDSYAVEWLSSRWVGPIERTLAKITARAFSVQFVTADGTDLPR